MSDASCLALDRVSPCRRPEGRAAGHQTWENLLFVHYTFPAEVVRPLVPADLELDLWRGEAWVGIVPFEMKHIRPAFVPIGLDFLETNLRTYVHRRGEPGVFFFSLEASSLLAVEAARFGWGLPYFHADMSTTREGDRVRYETRRRGASPPVRATFEYSVGAALGTSQAGTLEHFLLERYYLFTVTNGGDGKPGRVGKGQVHHLAYPAHEATLHATHDDLMVAAGLPRTERAPSAVHFSPGVEVEVFGPWDEPEAAEPDGPA